MVERLRIIAEPTRVQIMSALDGAPRGATVQEVADVVGIPHQNVSRHLGALYGAGIVSRRREGKAVRYVLRDWTALWIIEKMAASVEAQAEEDHGDFAEF